MVAHLPPKSRWPRALQGLAYLTVGQRTMSHLRQSHGSAFAMQLPFFGPTVVISDPTLAKEFFKQPVDAMSAPEPNLGLVLGAGSSFALEGQEHLKRRKLVMPQFHGDRMRAYGSLIETETRAQTRHWPECEEFPVRESMMRITLNAILRGVFGAEGEELDAMKNAIPRFIRLGSRLVLVPSMHRDLGRWSPWHRLQALRAEIDDIFASLIARALADPRLGQRSDILSLLLQARYDDETSMSHHDIGDELMALLVAGHETTATALAWAFERIRRHPDVLFRLEAELDADETTLLQAVVHEVLRSRPIIDAVARKVVAPSVTIGPWVIPRGHVVTCNIGLMHANESAFPSARVFDPNRFIGANPDMYAWVPFGGGSRRCPGAAFANMEMLTVLRTVLRDFTLLPTQAPDEGRRGRGVVFAPSKDGMIAVRRRVLGPTG